MLKVYHSQGARSLRVLWLPGAYVEALDRTVGQQVHGPTVPPGTRAGTHRAISKSALKASQWLEFAVGACFAPCDPGGTNPYLRAYQEGYIPGAASALFGR